MRFSILTFPRLVFSLVCVLCLSGSLFAQKRDIIHQGASVGIAVVPSLHGRFLHIKGASSALKDSLRKADKLKTNMGFGVQYRFKTGRDWFVTTGVYYSNMGFTRAKEPVNFLDTIHPNMPEYRKRITDDMQGFTREMYYHVNYHFLEFPVLFGKDFTPQHMKNGEVKLSWYFGGSAGGMLRHDMKIEFRGFEPYGMSSYTLKKAETELNPLVVNFSAIVGGRLEVDVYPKVKLYIQPQIKKHLLFASYGIERHHLYTLSGEVGLTFSLEKDKKDKK